MANALTSVTTDLTTFGRILLSAVQSNLVLARLTSRGNTAGAEIIGNKVEFPDIDVVGDAAIRAIGGAATASDMVSTKRTLTVQQIYKAITVDNLENLFSSVDLMQRAAERLAYKVVKKADGIIAGLWNQMPYEVGEIDGTAAFNSTDKFGVLADALKVLSVNEAPTDNLRLALGPAEANALRKLTEAWKVNESGSSDMLRNASLGRLFGFDIYESQQIQDATTATAAQTASPASVTGVQAAGTTALVVGGLGLTQTIPAGSSFSIAAFGTAGRRYVVTTAGASDGAGAATLQIYPGLEVASAGAEVITFTEHSAASSQNFAFHPDAIQSIAMAPSPFREGSGVASVSVSDPATGLAVRVASESKLLGGAGVAYSESLSADLVFGAAVIRPEWVVRITGD